MRRGNLIRIIVMQRKYFIKDEPTHTQNTFRIISQVLRMLNGEKFYTISAFRVRNIDLKML